MRLAAAWGDLVLAAVAISLFALWLGWKYRSAPHDCYTAVGAGVTGIILLALANYWSGWMLSWSALTMAATILALVASSWLERR